MSCWMFPATNGSRRLRVVLPLCQKDGRLLLENLRWQAELDGVKSFDCVLSVEWGTQVDLMNACNAAARTAYQNVEVITYPRAPQLKWPNAPNWAFQHAARYMQRGVSPWFWMEPDCVPLRPSWLDLWSDQYHARQKPIMGFIIPGMGHCNGTAVYPADFPALCPEAMTCTEVAWDGLMKRRTIHLTADASDLMCHVWGITNGRAQICGGDAAVFMTQKNVSDWVHPNAILFHRAKDTTLIERLRERRNENINPHRYLSQRPVLLGA